MTTDDDLTAHARALIDANRYLTLGTVDEDGHPWTTPVYFAGAGEWEFLWASSTDARHSVNLSARPRVSLVVFDSTVAPFHGRAVYAEAEATELSGSDIDRAVEVYPRRHDPGVALVTREEMSAPEPYRLYRATASRVWVLCPREPRQPCPRHGLAKDHRVLVTPAT